MELSVGDLVAGGDAIARLPSGKVVFVEGALPGETVEVELTNARKDYSRAVVTRVIDASDDRVEPPCRHVRRGCGGCQWQHFSASGQYGAKVRIALESLSRLGRIQISEELLKRAATGGGVPAAGYRTTVRLAFDEKGRAGFRQRSSNRVVDAQDCLVAHPMLHKALGAVSVRPGSEVEVTLRCSTLTGVVGAFIHGDESDVRGLDAVDVVGEDARLIESVNGFDLVVSMGSFFQSGPLAAEALIDAVRRVAGPEALSGTFGQVVDAYGGGGLFSATIVASHVPVVLIESNPWAIADARQNLAGRKCVLVESAVEEWKPQPAGLVIADPARTGLGQDAVAVLAATKAPYIVLVSCDAAAGARDARLLVNAGYELDDIVVLDLFPHTNHLEMVTRFRRVVPVDESRPVTRLAAEPVPPAA